jgi:hypothetical protein
VTRRERRSDDEPQICVLKKLGQMQILKPSICLNVKKGENDDQRMKDRRAKNRESMKIRERR